MDYNPLKPETRDWAPVAVLGIALGAYRLFAGTDAWFKAILVLLALWIVNFIVRLPFRVRRCRRYEALRDSFRAGDLSEHQFECEALKLGGERFYTFARASIVEHRAASAATAA